MPALVALGRRWQVASDDFVFPGFIDVLIRVSWVVAGCIIFWKEDVKLNCDGGSLIRNYLVGNFVVLLLIIFADIGLVQNSMNGNMMDLDARKYVVPCLYIRIVLVIPEVIWNALGTNWVYSNVIMCDNDAPESLLLIKILTSSSWTLVVLMLCMMAVAFDPMGGKSSSFEEMDYERFEQSVLHGNSHTKLWERRCKIIMCSCIGIDETHRRAFRDIGKIMGYLFEEDLVPSDLAAGLIVLNLNKKSTLGSSLQNDYGNSVECEGSSSTTNDVMCRTPTLKNFLDESSYEIESDRWHSPRVVAHFMKYALGSYGWPWYVVAHPLSGVIRLWRNILCCGLGQPRSSGIEGDNCCFCNTSALKFTTSVKDVDLLYASFQNNVFQTPFFIALDHEERCIVVAIRGTLSLRDAITDLSAEAKTLDYPGIPPGCKAHQGMLMTAKNILEKLNQLGTLNRAVNNYPAYTVVLTGHSLGAGTATLLSLMLRSTYPNLKCFAFSPPGCLVTEEAALFCESFVTSVIIGDDIVPRLSVPSFERFKNDLIRAIKECKIPKVSLAEVSHRMQRESVTQCKMYVAGKIMHVTERPIFESRPDLLDDGPRYEFRWATKEEFLDIKVTPRMMHDHYPDNVLVALNDIASANSGVTYYSVI